MKVETGKVISYLTWRFIMAFLDDWTGSADRGAGGGAADLNCAQLLGNSCQILEEILSQARFECVIEMSAKFRPHNDPIPVRIVLIKTPFVLIQTPSALIMTPIALTTTRFFLTRT